MLDALLISHVGVGSNLNTWKYLKHSIVSSNNEWFQPVHTKIELGKPT